MDQFEGNVVDYTSETRGIWCKIIIITVLQHNNQIILENHPNNESSKGTLPIHRSSPTACKRAMDVQVLYA
jgi:hypothetical protein